MEEILRSMVETIVKEIQEGDPRMLRALKEGIEQQLRVTPNERLEQVLNQITDILEGE